MDDGEQEISILLNVLSTDHRTGTVKYKLLPILLYLFCGNLSAGDFLNLTCLVPYTVILFVTSKTLRSIFVIGKVFWATLLETVIRSFSYELAFFQL